MKKYEATEEIALIKSILRKEDDEDFQRIVKWLHDSLWSHRVLNDSLVNAEGKPALSMNQGKCQVLDEILKFMTTAKQTLEKYKKNA